MHTVPFWNKLHQIGNRNKLKSLRARIPKVHTQDSHKLGEDYLRLWRLTLFLIIITLYRNCKYEI